MFTETIQRRYNPFDSTPIQVTRSNTRLHGYIPVWREVEGVSQILSGGYNFMFGIMSPATNEETLVQGWASMKDGFINISHSPITFIAIGFFARAYF